MKAVWRDTVIAESDVTVVVEGNHYFPRSSLVDAYFEATDHTTVCPWKGTASYFSVVVDDARNENAAWYYATPKSQAANIAGHVAFWKGVQVTE
ncbi:MAG: DUF427 domain-containing protein [Pseudomonadota bacterium]